METEVKSYRKLPVVIEAIRLSEGNVIEVFNFIGSGENDIPRGTNAEGFVKSVKENGYKIITLEGTMIANIGDWIIRGVNGEFYPCKDDIFRKTYDMNTILKTN